MQWTLEVVVVPVSDVDRAKSFYAEQEKCFGRPSFGRHLASASSFAHATSRLHRSRRVVAKLCM